MCLFVITIGLLADSPSEIYHGLNNIIKSQSVLITDYTVVGGLGATLINVGLCGIIVLAILYMGDLKFNGSLIMAFWLVFGFAFFGKNIINILPILFGGYLYSKNKGEPFSRYSLVAILSTTLAPAVSSVAYLFYPKGIGVALLMAFLAGIVIGFLMPAIATNAMKAHSGFNLYNVGFSGGVLGICIMGFFRVFDMSFPTNDLWGTEYGMTLTFITVTICLTFIIYGYKTSEQPKKDLTSIFKSKGRLVSDYYLLYKNSGYINMGISGLMALGVVFIIGADVNGGTLAGIFTTFGFGIFGKHPKNMYPVLIGSILTGVLTNLGITHPAIILGILFSTALSPIAGTFGVIDGIIAGSLHIMVVANLAPIHGGLSLYNNGLAAGLVAMILVPVFTTFRKGDFNWVLDLKRACGLLTKSLDFAVNVEVKM